MAFMLVPAVQASAAEFPLTLETEEGNGSGTIECEVEGGPAEDCETEYPEETELVFVAVPDTGSEFVEWEGDCFGFSDECELTIEEATFVSAIFELEEVTLETDWEGPGFGEIECEVEGGPLEWCENEYPYGTKIALVPVPDSTSEFVEWEGDCSGSGACELTMDEEKSVVAVFGELHFALEIAIEGNGGGTFECEVNESPAEPCKPGYVEGTEVAIVATPNEGSEFVEWEDCDEESGVVCEVTMEEDREVTAVIVLEEFELALDTDGEGSGEIECEVEGGPAEECEAEYPFGTDISLVAVPDLGSKFAEWEGDCSGSGACELTMDDDMEVTAIFDLKPPEFTLEVKKNGSGSGTVTSDVPGIDCGSECKAEYEEGETVTLIAEASIGSEFAGWEDCDEEPTETECEVTMEEEDRTVVATFELKPPSEFALTVSLAGTGSGSVTSSPPGIDCGIDCSDAYAAGTEVTLTATPASGSTFSGWSGACTGTGSCVVTMSVTRSVTATFEREATPPPGPGTAVVASTAKVKGGKALLKLTCKGEGACKGTLKLTAKVKVGKKTKNKAIGKASFSIAKGKKKTIKVKLSGPAKKTLAKKKVLKAKVKGSGVRSRSVKLKK